MDITEKHALNEVEKMGYEALGFEKKELEQAAMYDQVNRYYADEYMKTFPREHPMRDFAVGLIPQCYCVCYAFAMWAEHNHPIVELDEILQIPVYDWEDDYISAQRGRDCFAHVRTDRPRSDKLSVPSKVHKYWERFYEDVSRYVL